MKKTITFIAALVLAFGPNALAEERNYVTGVFGYDQLRDALVLNREWVPFPAYTDRAGWDALTGEFKQDIIVKGEEYLDFEWRVVKMTDYLELEKSGSRSAMEVPFGANIVAIASLFYAELAEGEGRFVPQIMNGVIHTCEMTSWSLSAHLVTIGPDRRPLPMKGDTTMDHMHGDISQMFSWIYYYLHGEFDKIHPEISRRLKGELVARELNPYLSRTDFWWMGFDPGYVLNNWNPWCNANALLSFMLIEDDLDRLARGVWKSMWSVDQYFNRIQGDGGIEEGPSYWTPSAGRLFEYLSVIKLATGGKVDLFGIGLVKGMGEYIVNSYMGDGWVVNFADASARGGAGNLNLIYRFGKALGSSTMMGYAARERDAHPFVPASGSTDVFDFLNSLMIQPEFKSASGEYATPDYTWYPETQFHYSRGSAGFYLAAKGGYNDESHNHNDVGNFILYLDSRPVLIDVGVGNYTYKTFSPQRYEIWSMQSNYHNLPLINGVAQRNGENYRASDVRSSRTSFSADIAGAYPEEASVKSWVRSYSFGGNSLSISDSFELKEAKAANQINFMIWGEVDTSVPGQVKIDAGARELILKYDAKVFDAVSETIALDDSSFREVWGEKVCRLSLNAKSMQRNGVYKYVISTRSASK